MKHKSVIWEKATQKEIRSIPTGTGAKLVMNPTNQWTDKKPISVATSEYIKTLTEKRDKSINSYEKRMYSKMIQEELDGICSHCHRSYEMVDYKKQYREDEFSSLTI